MANNHYQMSERATAQIEIDYLRDELKKAKEQAKNPVFARAVLRKQGFFVENLGALTMLQTGITVVLRRHSRFLRWH